MRVEEMGAVPAGPPVRTKSDAPPCDTEIENEGFMGRAEISVARMSNMTM